MASSDCKPEAKEPLKTGVSNGDVAAVLYEPVVSAEDIPPKGWMKLSIDEKVKNREPSLSDTTASSVGGKRERWSKELEFMLAAVGNAVGLGNLWRFPYLVYVSGGGAFLIPYFLMLTLCGIPLLYMELSVGQYTQRGPVGAIKLLSPFFQGVGLATVVLSFLFCSYYGVIMSWAFYYMGASLQRTLPWTTCGHWWNSDQCWSNMSESALIFRPNDSVSPTEEYFKFKVLQQSDGIGDADGFVWYLVGLLFLTWVAVYLCLFKGIAWTGKIVYFTVSFPYLVLILLIIRGCTLPGAKKGIEFFLIPDWSLLKDPIVWINAAAQNFNSIGIAFGSMITFSSYNKQNKSIFKNVLWICLVDAFTAILAGFAVFSILGNIAENQDQSVKDVVTSGPGLAFVVYPQAFVTMPNGFAQAFSFIFFFMLICLAIDSLFASVEVVITSIEDQLGDYMPPGLKRKEVLVLMICLVLFFMGLPSVTRGGIYYFRIIDVYSSFYSLMLIALFEVIAVAWSYGACRLADNVREMNGVRPQLYFVGCWYIVSPLLIGVIMVFNWVQYEPVTYGDYPYPDWAHALGWCLAGLSLICLPLGMGKAMYDAPGSNLWQKLRSSFQPLINSSYDVEKSYENNITKNGNVLNCCSNGTDVIKYNTDTV